MAKPLFHNKIQIRHERGFMEKFIENDVEIDVDEHKVYQMPSYVIRHYKNKYLVIASDYGRWLVFSSEMEINIFRFLADNHSIKDTLERFDEDAVIDVLSQIEAKKFTALNVCNIDNAETMQIYLTNACNLCCKHCYMYAESSLKDELTLEEVLSICISFKKAGGQYVTLSGGEVSIRKDFCRMLREIHKIGLGIHILSNGVAWNDELINAVLEINPERVQISLDGFDEMSNAMVRGKGNFLKSLDTIDRLAKNNVNVYVAVTPLYHIVLEHKQEYIQFAKQLVEKYKDNHLWVNFSFELLEGREISHMELKEYSEKYLSIMSEICEAVYPGANLDGFILNHNSQKIFNNCGYGRLNISPVGDIYFCSRIGDVKKYGNIRKDSFDKIMKLMERAREISDISNLEPCKACELKYICGGGCRVDNFNELTNIDNLFVDEKVVFARTKHCTVENKEYFYQLMIDSNERLYE